MDKTGQDSAPAEGDIRPPTREGFDTFFAAAANSPTLRRIWREAYGNEYPEEADPFSFVTRTDLRRIASDLSVGPGQTFADLACGRGGPGLWVAQQTGAALIGIDFSQVGIGQATHHAQALGLREQATFLVRDIAATGLPDACLDGAMSVDALQLFPDPAAAVLEIARLLRSGAHFVFTTWDMARTPPGRSPRINGHRPLLEHAGFVVQTYEETPDWERRQHAVFAGVLAARSALLTEMGEVAESSVLQEAQEMPRWLPYSKHILVVARKR